MSNELNLEEIAIGVLDAGIGLEFYCSGTTDSYDSDRGRAWFYTVSPDPALLRLELGDTHADFEVVRQWATVWTTNELSNSGFTHVHQTNAAIRNTGTRECGFRLVRATTDN